MSIPDFKTAPPLGEGSRKALYLAVKHSKPLEIDFDAMVKEGGYKDLKSAQNAWYYVKKTILDGAPPGSARAKPATPRKSTGANGLSTPRKRKGSAAANGHGGSASKKPKGDNASDEGDNNEDDLKHVKEEKTDDADADDE